MPFDDFNKLIPIAAEKSVVILFDEINTIDPSQLSPLIRILEKKCFSQGFMVIAICNPATGHVGRRYLSPELKALFF